MVIAGDRQPEELMSSPPKIFYGWWVVAAAAVGLFFSGGPIVVFSFGVFLKSISHEFHTGRAAVSLAFTIHNFLSALVNPFFGRLADRFGARRVVLPAAVCFGLILISARLIGSSLWQFYVFYSLLGLTTPAASAVPYGTAVSRWFDRRRGLALGLMMFGLGMGAIIMPAMAQRLIARFGWRSAYAVIGCTVISIPILVVGLVLKEDPRQKGLFPDGAPPNDSATKPVEGLTWPEIPSIRAFWLMISAFFLAGASGHACVLHMPALLSDRGATPHAAAAASSLIGVAMLFGRAGSGYFLDRFFAPNVAGLIFGQAAIGVTLLAAGASDTAALVAAFMVGLAFGAEVEVIGYLVSRYFGLRCLGTTFGFGFSSFVLAGAVGAFMMGLGFDRTHSYALPLVVFSLAMFGAAGIIMCLGPYRFAAHSAAKESPLAPAPGGSRI